MKISWGLDQVPDQSGRTVIITGANSGIGYEAALALAKRKANLVLACRNPSKAQAAANRIAAQAPTAELEVRTLDLADLGSVRAFVDEFSRQHDRLDLLINNAGVMAIPRTETQDGFEMQFGTNHLGHFALTGALLDTLLGTPDSRVVTVSSIAHQFGKMHFRDLNWTRSYNKWAAYGQSKLANLLFTHELDRRLKRAGASTIAVSCHPGWASTNLQAKGPQMEGSKLMERVTHLANSVFAQDAAGGALPTLYAAIEPLSGDEFIGPTSTLGWTGSPGLVQPRDKARSAHDAARLWEASEALTEVAFPV